MASNDGQRLTIFGLTYRQHDNRSMQRILREYGRLPENPGERAGLFVALTALARDLDEERSESINNWLHNGGEFPSPGIANSVQSTAHEQAILQSQNDGFPPPHITRPPLNDHNPGRIPHGRSHPNYMPRPGGIMGPGIPTSNPRANPGAFTRASYLGSRSGAFIGAGRPLVDHDAFVPEFPSANAPSSSKSVPSIEVQNQPTLTGFSRPLGNATGETSLLDFQNHPRRRLRNDGFNQDLDQMDTMEPENHHDQPEWQEDWESSSAEENEQDEEDSDDSEDENDDMDIEDRLADPPGAPVQRSIFPAMQNTHMIDPPETSSEDYPECSVCMETQPLDMFPLSPNITATCQHEDDRVVCLTCIEHAIRTPVDQGILNLVTCPICPAKLSVGEVRLYASERIFARYQYLLMSLNPDMVFCLAARCGLGQLHSIDELGPMMTCETCSFKTCVVHKLPWHEGMTCEEFDCDESQIERLEQDEATAKLLASLSSKICPTCKQGVDRTAGCDHLMCRCGGQWCFECLASWENILRIGVEAHAPTCKNHPRRVQLRADQKQANEAKILESVHGGKISEALQQARIQRDVRNRERMRPLALEAAERRAKEDALARQREEISGNAQKKQKKAKLIAPWEER